MSEALSTLTKNWLPVSYELLEHQVVNRFVANRKPIFRERREGLEQRGAFFGTKSCLPRRGKDQITKANTWNDSSNDAEHDDVIGGSI